MKKIRIFDIHHTPRTTPRKNFTMMKVFDWFTSKTTKKAQRTKHYPRSVDTNASSQEVSKVAILFNETTLQKKDALRKAIREYEEHQKSKASLKRELDEAERRKQEAEFDLQSEKDVTNDISSKKIKNEQERHQIREAQNDNRNNLKIKQNSLDKCNDELNMAHDQFKEAETKKETLQKRIDEEQKDYDKLISSANTAKQLVFNVDAIDEANALAMVPVENDVVSIEKELEVTTLKTVHGFTTEVLVKSPNGEEMIYKKGELVKVKWDGRPDNGEEIHVDGVSFTDMMNHACFGMIERILSSEGKVMFGLRFYYYSHFQIEGDPRVRSVQKFLNISDRIWKSKDIDTDDIFRSRESVEYHEIDAIQDKHELEEGIRWQFRWEYNNSGKLYIAKKRGGPPMTPSTKKRGRPPMTPSTKKRGRPPMTPSTKKRGRPPMTSSTKKRGRPPMTPSTKKRGRPPMTPSPNMLDLNELTRVAPSRQRRRKN